MTFDQKLEQLTTNINLLSLKSSAHDAELNQLTKNLNELTLKVDVFASQHREEQATMAQTVERIAQSHERLAHTVDKLALAQTDTLATVRELAGVVGRQEKRIRRLESPPAA